MNIHTMLMASSAFVAFGLAAHADCAEELARLTGDTMPAASAEGISKDGSLAPLEDPDASDAAADAGASGTSDASAGDTMSTTPEAATAGDTEATPSGEAIAKDGSLVPLEESDGSGNSDLVAMSGQDAQAQQEGEPTAAAEAAGAETAASDDADGMDGADGTSDPDRDEILARAQEALDAGDEDACMAALDELEAM